MNSLHGLLTTPEFAIGAMLSVLAIVVLVTSRRYRLRIKKGAFELLMEPHENGAKTTGRHPKSDDR